MNPQTSFPRMCPFVSACLRFATMVATLSLAGGQISLPSHKVDLGEKDGLGLEIYFEPVKEGIPQDFVCSIQNSGGVGVPFESRGLTNGYVIRLFDSRDVEIPNRYLRTEQEDRLSPGHRAQVFIDPHAGLAYQLNLEETFGSKWRLGVTLEISWDPGEGPGVGRGKGLSGALDLVSGEAIPIDSRPNARSARSTPPLKLEAEQPIAVQESEAGPPGETSHHAAISPTALHRFLRSPWKLAGTIVAATFLLTGLVLQSNRRRQKCP